LRRSFLQLALLAQRDAQVGVAKRVVGLTEQGFLNVAGREILLAALRGKDAQHVQRIGIGRLDLEGLPIEVLGVQQLPGPVGLHGAVQPSLRGRCASSCYRIAREGHDVAHIRILEVTTVSMLRLTGSRAAKAASFGYVKKSQGNVAYKSASCNFLDSLSG
jgi:hypothetical protein